MHLREVRPVGVARDVIGPRRVVDNVDPQLGEVVHDADHAALVSWDHLGGEQERVALLQFQTQVAALAELGGGGASFPLAAGDQKHDVLARHLHRVLGRNGAGEIGQQAGLHRRFHHAAHRAAQKADGPARRVRRLRQRLEPRDVGREGRGDHHSGGISEKLRDRRAERRLRPAGVVREDIGGIADQRLHPVLRHLREHGGIEGITDDRGHVDLEIARMQHPARRRIDAQPRAFRNGVTDRQVADGEGPCLRRGGPGVHHLDHGLGLAMFRQLALGDVRGEGAAVDRRADLLPQHPDGADVVFVRVGDEDAHHVLPARAQPGDVGHDQVHAGRRIHVREGHAEVHDDQLLLTRGAVAIDIGVHPDLSRASQREVDEAIGAGILLLSGGAHAASSLKRCMTVSPCMVRSSSKASNSASACWNSGARPPVEMMRMSSRPRSALIRAHISRTRPT